MSFAKELMRAAAQRGQIDDIYQELSDDLTLILQQMFPVWAMIGPGLAEPGHIVLRSRTVYLDSDELLGSKQDILAGQLERRAILRTYGVSFHEVFHAMETKLWVSERDGELSESEDPDDQQLAVDRQLLEEPRMEAHGCRRYPEDKARGRFIRLGLEAAVVDCILPRFIEQVGNAMLAGQPVSRDMAGRAMTYLKARTHYGVIRPQVLAPLEPIWQQVLGADDIQKLDDLYAQLIWVPSGENEMLSDWAREYRDIIGPPDPPPPSQGGDGEGEGESGEGQGSGQGGGEGSGQPTPGSLKEALEQACEQTRSEQLEQLNEDVDLAETVDQADPAGDGGGKDGKGGDGKGSGTGAPTGRIPDRGVDRPPFADEVAEAKKFAKRLLEARRIGLRRIDKRMPGGRFDGRAYARGRFQRRMRQPVTSHPWNITQEITAPLEEPHILLVVDTSGSMGSYEYALGPIVWIVTTAMRTIGGRVVTTLFGNSAALLDDGTQPMANVPGIKVGGGTAFAGDAIVMGTSHLEMENPRRPRALYVLSDGGWYDTQAGVVKIRELANLGVPTIHISIGCEPLSVEAERISVIRDPAESLDIIATDTVEALSVNKRRR